MPKKPWTPKVGEKYWTIDVNLEFCWGTWDAHNRINDFTLGIYRTKSKALAARKRIREVVKEMMK